MSSDRTANPYVGLRPFFARDSRVFFGRDEQVSELLQILHENRFLPVVGSSGSGKSSLVRAGLIPKLRAGFLVGERDTWQVASFRPGDAPILNFVTELADTLGQSNLVAGDNGLEATVRASLEIGALEFIAQHQAPKASLLILVDQFEELFAFRGSAADDDSSSAVPTETRDWRFTPAEESTRRAKRRVEAADFVDLLLGIANQRELSVFIVVTMRSDFLGDCDLFQGLPEAMNRARYLVPRLSREQLRQAIDGPAFMSGAEVSARLIDRLLDELGDRTDRLPVLQHALQQTWSIWAQQGRTGQLDIAQFDAAGGLEHALEQDAERALESVNAGATERVFRALTDTDAENRRVRRPCRIDQLATVAGVERVEVERIIKAFQSNERNYLYVSDDGIPDNLRVDISHESLIRQWPRLAAWVDRERKSRDSYLQLVQMARANQNGERELMAEREFAVQSRIWQELGATGAWAARYARAADDFQVTQQFISASATSVENERVEKQQREAEAAEMQRRKRRQRRTFWSLAGAASAIVIVVFAVLLARADDALRDADRANRLAVIRDLALSDPTIAATLVTELAEDAPLGTNALDSLLSWSDVATLRAIADADIAMELANSIVDVAAVGAGSGYAMLASNGAIRFRSASNSPPRTLASGAASAAYLAVDSAGIYAATTDAQGNIWITSLVDSMKPRELTGARSGRVPPIISRDGSQVIGLCETGALCLWATHDDSTQRTPIKFASRCDEIVAMDLRHDVAQAVVGCRDGRVWLYSTAAGQAVQPAMLRNVSDSGRVSAVRYSPDGKFVAMGTLGGEIQLWNVDTPRAKPRTFTDNANPLRPQSFSYSIAWFALHFDASGKRLLAAGAGAAMIWEIAHPDRAIRSYYDHDGDVLDAEFSPDGEWVASVSRDATTRVWSVRDTSRALDRIMTGHGGAVFHAVFSRNGQVLVSLANDSSARVWSMVHDAEPLVVLSGSVSSTGSGADVDVWKQRITSISAASGDTLLSMSLGDGRLLTSVLSFDTASNAFSVRVAPRTPALWPVVPRQRITHVTYVGDTLYAAGKEDADIVVYRVAPSQPPFRMAARSAGGTRRERVSLNAQATVAAISGRDHVAVWRFGAGEKTETLIPLVGDYYDMDMRLSADGSIALAIPHNYFAPRSIWRVSDGQKLGELPDTGSTLYAFSESTRQVGAVQSDNQLRVYSSLTDSNRTFTPLRGAPVSISAVAFSRDARLLLAADEEGAVNVWAPGQRAGLLRMEGHEYPITSATFSSDGKHVITGALDGTVTIATISAPALIKRIVSYTNICVPQRVRVERLRESEANAKKVYDRCEARLGKR